MGERIIAVVGARLNSSRLPKKHFLPLAGKPLIERLWDRLEKVRMIDQIVLATTDDDYNEPLKHWAQNASREYVVYKGDVNDLVGRVDSVVRLYDADILVYICGDCPLVEPDTVERMLDRMVGKSDVEAVVIARSERGDRSIHEGFDIYRREFWNRMVLAAEAPFEKEHIGAVYHHLNKVAPLSAGELQEPDQYYALDHRISVDTPTDYRFMRKVYADWYINNSEDSIVDLSWVIERLRTDVDLKGINQHVYQKKIKDRTIKVTIVTEAGPLIGMGHLIRMLVAAAALQDYLGANVNLMIAGKPIELADLALVRHEWVTEFPRSFWQEISAENDVVVFDLKECPEVLLNGKAAFPKSCLLVGVDLPVGKASFCDLNWVPSFYSQNGGTENGTNIGGWDCFLLRDAPQWQPQSFSGDEKRVLVLSGGSDAAKLGHFLPNMLLEQLSGDVKVDWVQGPYASAPSCNQKAETERFDILHAPEDLPALLVNYDAVLCVYGVSFFECLRSGVPTIVFDAVGAAKEQEWKELKENLPNNTADDVEEALRKLEKILKTKPEAMNAVIGDKMRQGPKHFADVVANRLLSSWN